MKKPVYFLLMISLLGIMACSSESETGSEPAEAVEAPQTAPESPTTPATAPGEPALNFSSSPETQWTVSINPEKPYKVGDELEITFNAEMVAEKWHLYSTQPSPESAYTPTEFDLFVEEGESQDIELVGRLTENNEPHVEFDEVMEGDVRFFKEKSVSFTQKFKITGPNPTIMGSIYGQICLAPEDGGQCKPLRLPFDYTFSAE